MKKNVMIFAVPRFYSVEDEDHFFKWLYSLRTFKEVSGAGRELRLTLKTSRLSQKDRRELIAIFSRYNIKNGGASAAPRTLGAMVTGAVLVQDGVRSRTEQEAEVKLNPGQIPLRASRSRRRRPRERQRSGRVAHMLRVRAVLAVVAITYGGVHAMAQTATLACSPLKLRSKDTLVLRFAKSHPSELAIKGPDGIWFFLVYEPDGPNAVRQPIVSKSSFAGTRTLSLPIATAVGSPWVAGREPSERIFVRPGKYEVVLTDVLESDAGHRVFRCGVEFNP
jgi:hypothetical protein